MSDTLVENSVLNPNEVLSSLDGRCRLTLHEDGNLELCVSDTISWMSGTQGNGIAPFSLRINPNGILDVRDVNGKVIWSTTKTSDAGPFRCIVGEKGNKNVVVQDAKGYNLWASDAPGSILEMEKYDELFQLHQRIKKEEVDSL
jgi:hypothetical protein